MERKNTTNWFTLHIWRMGEYPLAWREVIPGYLSHPVQVTESDYCFCGSSRECWNHFLSYEWEKYVFSDREIKAYEAVVNDYMDYLRN